MSEFKIDTDILSMCNNGIKKNSELFSSEFASFSYGKIAQYSLLADMLASIKKQAKQIESDFNTITSKCSNFIDNIIEVENKMSNDEIEHKKIVFNSISISWRNTTPTPSAITSQIDIMSKYYEQHPSSNTQNTASQNTVSATKPVEANNQQTSQNFDLGSSIANNFMGTIDMYKGWFKTGVNKISNDVKNATADAIMTVEDYWVSGAETLLDKWTSGANTINNFIDEKWNTGYNCMKSSGGFVSATADVFKAINDVTIGVRDATKDTIVEVNDAMINLSKNDIDYLSKVRNNELSIGDYFSIKAQESAATYTQMGLSLLGGLSKGGEALLDTAATAITGIVSLPTFVYDLCTGSSVTYSLYQAKDKFVEKDYVGDSQKLLYNNDFGKWVNNHSAFDSDGNVSNFLSSVGEMVTVLATGSVMGGSEAATKATVALSGLKGFGRAEETALQDGASSVEAAAYGLASGVWDAVQMGVGMKINSWVSSNLTTASAMQNVAKASNLKVTTFATSVWLDGIDAGIEGYVQPALQMIYKDRKEGESFKEFYNRLYNEMGGKDYVGRQFLLGALMSAASTGKDLATNKYGKDFQNMTERYQELENIRNTDEYKAYMDDVKNGKEVDLNSNFKNVEQEYASIANELKKITEAALKADNGDNDIGKYIKEKISASIDSTKEKFNHLIKPGGLKEETRSINAEIDANTKAKYGPIEILASTPYKYLEKSIMSDAGINDIEMYNKIMNDGLIHFTSLDSANKIIESGEVRPSKTFLGFYDNNKAYFFAGTPTFGQLSINLFDDFKCPTILTGVRIKPTEAQLDGLKFRYLDDMAVSKKGKFTFDSGQAEIVYYGITKNAEGQFAYQQITEEMAANYDEYLKSQGFEIKHIKKHGAESSILAGVNTAKYLFTAQTEYTRAAMKTKTAADKAIDSFISKTKDFLEITKNKIKEKFESSNISDSIDQVTRDDVNARLDAQKLEASGSKVVENDILNSKQNFETKIDDLVAETIQINSEIKTVDAINNYVEQYKKNIELKNKLNELSDSDLELYNIKLLNELLKNNSQKISDNLEFYYSDYTALQFFNQAVNSLDDKNELINAFKKITDGSDVSIISSWRDTEFIDNYNGLFFKISESDIINQNYDSVYKMIGELLASRADDALLNNYQQKLDNINIDDNRYNKMVNDIMNERLSINKNILESLPDADIVNESQVIKEFYDNNQKLNGCCEFISTVNSLSFGDDILYGLNSPSSIIYSNKSLRDSLAIFTKYKLENNEVALSQIKDIFGDEFYKSYENLYEDNMSKIKNMTVKEIPKNEILAQNMDLFESAEDMFESIKNKFEAWGKEDLYLNSLSESEREAYFNSQIKPENKEYIDRLEKAFMHNDDPNLNSDSLSFNLFKRAMNDLLENNPEYGKLFIDAFIFTQKECNISFIADFGQTANYDSSLHTINFDEMIIKNNDYGVAYHEATHLLDGEFKEDHVSEFRPERSATFLHDVRSSIDETNLKKILDEREKLSSMLEDYAREKVDMISIKRQFIESREKVLDDFINKYKLGDKSFENSELSNEELQKFDNLLDGLHFKKRFTENNLPKNMETLKSLEEIYESYTDAVLTKAIEQKYDNMVYQFYDKMVREVANYDELLTSLYGGRDNFFNKFNGNLYGHSDDYYVPTASFGYTKITDEGLAEFSRLTLTKNETGLKQLKAVLGEDLYNYYDEYFNNLMDHIRKTIYNNEN